jgi:hypothetical protein
MARPHFEHAIFARIMLALGILAGPSLVIAAQTTPAAPTLPVPTIATSTNQPLPLSERPDQSLPLARRAKIAATSQEAGGEAGGASATKAVSKGWRDLLATALPLSAVIALIFGVSAVVRRTMRHNGGLMSQLGAGGRAPSGVLEVLGRYPVSRGLTLVVLKLDRRVLLVNQTAGRGFAGVGAGMSTLTEITDPDEVASIVSKMRDRAGESISRKFHATLVREDADAARSLSSVETSSHDEIMTKPASIRDGSRALRAKLAAARGTPIEGGTP